ncbi:MAG: 50S ribosomal protein L21 [Pirellulaceae bacterium]
MNTYAIIAADGRQYKVEEGQEIQVDLREELEGGATVTFDQVLVVSDGTNIKLGKPTLAGAVVTAEVINALEKGEKVFIQKMRRRKNYRRRTGHRQKYTRVKISKISA